MSGIPDSSRDALTDAYGLEADGLTRDKIANTAIQKARVVSFDPLTGTALVRPLRAGYGDLIRVQVKTDYMGPVKGSGKAVALHPGQQVDIEYVDGNAYGLYSTGQVSGGTYTKIDSPAPAYAPWQQNGTGTVTVHAQPDGTLGNAEHVSASSETSRTNMGSTSTEDWGNEHSVSIGTNITRAEEQLREASTTLLLAAKLLGGDLA